jgi:hypothetical protein
MKQNFTHRKLREPLVYCDYLFKEQKICSEDFREHILSEFRKYKLSKILITASTNKHEYLK